MEHDRVLRGACTCGRNSYLINLPASASQAVEVMFDNSSSSRRTHAAPLTAFLRVPLSSYQSTTYAFYPDETHAAIRRNYVSLPPHESTRGIRHQFCGFCGTQLNKWEDHDSSEPETITVTLGSLLDDDVYKLEELGFLSQAEDIGGHTRSNSGAGVSAQLMLTTARVDPTARVRGAPWFEDLVADTPLGKARRRAGEHVSADGSSRTEWEVVELDDGGFHASQTITSESINIMHGRSEAQQ